ncbi:hypothetical protein FUAX_55710 (plasmid) [Fulvitalea axinellae]|uniref:Uncharacterized protein n=1 Tax=Fulvitalea axinellae TaxID=1182444 RepID=A0AAU9CMJ5_9BACT|nr:hypothetical protein FUAX_55710 [Fulvitalea axinellae]
MFLVTRVFKNWKTSLLGLVILTGALGAVYTGKASLTEAGLFIAGGIGLFFTRDGKGVKNG